MLPASVVVLTKDEEQNIGDCLASVAAFAEVFVVDSGSSDRTSAIAEAAGARVVEFTWNGRYPKKKQWALENLPFGYDWVLYLDADERVTPPLATEIGRVLRSTSRHAGYFIGLDYVFLGRRLRRGQRVSKLALLDRNRAHFADVDDLGATNMWEVEGHYQPELRGSAGRLRERILHNDRDSLYGWFARHNRYSDWEAVLAEQGRLLEPAESQPRSRRLLKGVFARLPMRGLASFVWFYVFRLGFLDRRPGFHYALAKAFYYWQVGVKVRELRLLRESRAGEAKQARGL
jgi:glycosyltransferase involved in cell wall biosynthesis